MNLDEIDNRQIKRKPYCRMPFEIWPFEISNLIGRVLAIFALRSFTKWKFIKVCESIGVYGLEGSFIRIINRGCKAK